MNHTLLIAVLAGLGGMLGWGSADFFAKKTVDRIGSIKGLVWGHLCGTAILLIVTLSQLIIFNHHAKLPIGLNNYGLLLGFGILQMIVYWLTYTAFEKGQLSVISPVFASFPGLVAIGSVLFFNEKINLITAIALIVIFIGNLAVGIDINEFKNKNFRLKPGLKEISLAVLLAAIWTLGWDKLVKGKNPVSYALVMYAFMSLAAIVLARLTKTKLSGVPKSVWRFLGLIGLGEAAAYLAISWGYSSTSRVSVVALISGTFSIPTLILSYLFLKERLSRPQLLTIILIICGIAGVSIS